MVVRVTEIVGLSALLVAGACDPEDLAADEVTLRGLEDNGMQLNGMQLNGMRLNGMRLNGAVLVGDTAADFVQITRIDLKSGDKGSHTWLTGSQISVEGKTGVVYSGANLTDAKLSYFVQEAGKSKSKEVRIAQVKPLAPGSDVMLYQLEINDGGWQPLCQGGAEAIMLGDVWHPATGDRLVDASDDALTFACRGAALAKCVEFGYRPWAGASLREYHQACTRMVRADYCGDGTPHTADGTPIHVLDQLGVQTADPTVDYVVEAEWGPDGAVCLNAANTRHPGQDLACDIPACGASFASGGLIQSGKVLPKP